MVSSYSIFRLQCILNFIHTVLQEAWPILATVPAYCSRYVHFSGLTTTTRESQLGALSWGPLKQALSFPFVCISFRKSQTVQCWEVQIVPWSMNGLGDCSRLKTIWGSTGQHLAFPKADDNGKKKLVNIPSSFLQDLNECRELFCFKRWRHFPWRHRLNNKDSLVVPINE